MTAWHELPASSPGSRRARWAAWILALAWAGATALYVVATVVRDIGSFCLTDPEDPRAPDCPPAPPPPEEWLLALRWGAWSAGALAVLFTLVLAGQAVQGRRPARHAWIGMAVTVAAGLAFSALVLLPER